MKHRGFFTRLEEWTIEDEQCQKIGISYSSTNGSLVLKGSVKTQAQRNEANKLAKAVPNVKEVVK